MSNVLSHYVMTARKRYYCGNCGCLIDVGEKYHRFVMSAGDENDFGTFRLCGKTGPRQERHGGCDSNYPVDKRPHRKRKKKGATACASKSVKAASSCL